MRSFFAIIPFCLCLAHSALAQDQASRASVLILDASGSMWAQLDEGRSRIEVARDVLDDFLGTRSADAPLGVIAYGHNRRGDCSDIAVVAPVGRQDPSRLAAALRAISPRGKTPIADALRLAASQVPATAEDADIVLVTDGLETCGGDPCAVAAEFARAGIPMRAHVVGFGLTEGEVAQIACVAEQTGGMVLSTQSGAELAEALVRTTTSTRLVEAETGMAKINLTIDADIAGRPDRVAFRGVNEATNTSVEFGTLDFSQGSALAVDLTEGNWLLTADAGELGHGELVVSVQVGDNRAIYIPFTGLMPKLDLTPPLGGMRAGASGIFPHRITREGIAAGGADFVLSLLPRDAATTEDRAVTWSMQDASLGSVVARLNLPAEPGQYLVAYHRYGETDLAKALKRFELSIVARPDVTLVAPEAVEPGAVVPATVTGGLAHADRLEIWKDGQLYSWDQSRYMEQLFESRYGPASLLVAPAEAGEYELVYVFSDIDGPDSIAARQPLRVGDATFEDAFAAGVAPRCDDDTGCGMGEDMSEGVIPVMLSTDDAEGGAVEWFVQPLEVENGQAVESGGPVRGVWETALDAGIWAVTGIADGATYFQQIEVSAGGEAEFVLSADSPIEVPMETAQPAYTFVCKEDFQCVYEEAIVGIVTILPPNWAVDQPTRATMTAGGQGGPLRLTFTDTADPSQWMVLNPRQWVEENGPCFEVQAGQLCHVAEASETTLAALDLVRRSLRDTAPRQIADPAKALAEAMSSFAGDDPAAAEAMGALLGAAQGAEGGPDLGAILEGAMGGFKAPETALPGPDALLTDDQFDALRQQLTGN